MSSKKIETALISVFNKEGLDKIVVRLNELGVKLISTGGTFDFIKKLNIPVTSVDSITNFPEILGGRVKTLHPKIFGGILARREDSKDMQQIAEHIIPLIDCVIVDLYPFEDTVKSTNEEQKIIEKIDIGGIALIRAAAKNFKDTLIISDRRYYADFLDLLNQKNGCSDKQDRHLFATKAFAISSHYDTQIFKYFNTTHALPYYKESFLDAQALRYGENSHQKGWFFGNLTDSLEKLNGKEISYNNLLDIDAAINLINDFSEPSFAIIKHNNACGLASRNSIHEAYLTALSSDPLSAFGGVLIGNRKIDLTTAQEINKLFFEVLIAPQYDDDALNLLKSKTNRIILLNKNQTLPQLTVRSAINGILIQERDTKTETTEDLKSVTEKIPTTQEAEDLIFANKIVKHTKSNAIVIVKNKQLIGSGTGQTSRVDAVNHAIEKAKRFNFETKGAVLASDAFFPFPDSVELAYKAGISAIVQPGGSVKDKDSIDACNKYGMAMVFTGFRHFKH